GYLLLADAYAPGWHAYLDGVSTKVYPADVAMRAVAVPEGVHEVVFRYSPLWWWLGLPLAGLGVLLGILWNYLRVPEHKGQRLGTRPASPPRTPTRKPAMPPAAEPAPPATDHAGPSEVPMGVPAPTPKPDPSATPKAAPPDWMSGMPPKKPGGDKPPDDKPPALFALEDLP
ncbi:MAG: hypothetical protein V3U11_00445, partial [Planctomycetota bacterium]